MFIFTACGVSNFDSDSNSFTENNAISDVINYYSFGDWGSQVFPVNRGYYSNDTIGNLRLTWYNNIDPQKTVEIANYLKNRADNGKRILRHIHRREKCCRPCSLFFFKGAPNAKFAVYNAGGGELFEVPTVTPYSESHNACIEQEGAKLPVKTG